MAMFFWILLIGAFMIVPMANGLKCWKKEDAKSDAVEATCKDDETNCLSVTCKGDGEENVFGGCSGGGCDGLGVALYNGFCDALYPSNTKTCSSCSGNDLCLKIDGGSKKGGVTSGTKIGWTVLFVVGALAANKLLRFHRGDTTDLLI